MPETQDQWALDLVLCESDIAAGSRIARQGRPDRKCRRHQPTGCRSEVPQKGGKRGRAAGMTASWSPRSTRAFWHSLQVDGRGVGGRENAETVACLAAMNRDASAYPALSERDLDRMAPFAGFTVEPERKPAPVLGCDDWQFPGVGPDAMQRVWSERLPGPSAGDVAMRHGVRFSAAMPPARRSGPETGHRRPDPSGVETGRLMCSSRAPGPRSPSDPGP